MKPTIKGIEREFMYMEKENKRMDPGEIRAGVEYIVRSLMHNGTKNGVGVAGITVWANRGNYQEAMDFCRYILDIPGDYHPGSAYAMGDVDFVDMYRDSPDMFRECFSVVREKEAILKDVIFPIDKRNDELDEWLTKNYGELTEKIGVDEIAVAAAANTGKGSGKIEGD